MGWSIIRPMSVHVMASFKSHMYIKKNKKVLRLIFLVILANRESHEKHCSHTSVST